MKSGILAIETSGKFCSVAYSENGNDIFHSISLIGQSHAGMLANMTKSILQAASKDPSSLAAISVVSGPGSYTGLRIGLSFAKGLCFANQTPLISITSVENIAFQVFDENLDVDLVIVAIDAMRNEVYSGIVDREMKFYMKTRSLVLDEVDLPQMVFGKKVAMAGDGAFKAMNFYNQPAGINFLDGILPNAKSSIKLAWKKMENSQFESVESFEPEYIKPVYITGHQ